MVSAKMLSKSYIVTLYCGSTPQQSHVYEVSFGCGTHVCRHCDDVAPHRVDWRRRAHGPRHRVCVHAGGLERGGSSQSLTQMLGGVKVQVIFLLFAYFSISLFSLNPFHMRNQAAIQANRPRPTVLCEANNLEGVESE